jgi:hypothetical protein
MKLSSLISTLSSFILLGFILVVALPSLAKIKKSDPGVSVMDQPISEVLGLSKEDFQKRDYCNTEMSSMSFASGRDADSFLEKCLNEASTETLPNVDSPLLGTNNQNQATTTRLTGDELITKCNEFMTRARFDSEKSANSFLKNCLAGK